MSLLYRHFIEKNIIFIYSVDRIMDFMPTKYLCVLIHIWSKGEIGATKTGLSPPLEYFTDHFKAILHLWIFRAFSVLCLLYLSVCLFTCALWLPAGKELTSWLSFVVSGCEFVTFPLVSWVRCGTWLYQLLLFVPLLTFSRSKSTCSSTNFPYASSG